MTVRSTSSGAASIWLKSRSAWAQMISVTVSRSTEQIADFLTNHDRPGFGCFLCVNPIKDYGVRFSDVWSAGLHLVSLVGHDPLLGVLNRNGRIEPTELYKELLERVGDIKPRMTVIASSADVFGGNEIDRSQVRQFVHLLNRLAIVADGSVILIAHPSLTGINSGTGLSGSTQWHNATRARDYLQHVKPTGDELPDPDLRLLEFKKNNYGPISESIYLRYQNGLFLPADGVLGLNPTARAALAETIFLQLLERFIRQKQVAGPKSGTSYAPALFARHPDAQGLS